MVWGLRACEQHAASPTWWGFQYLPNRQRHYCVYPLTGNQDLPQGCTIVSWLLLHCLYIPSVSLFSSVQFSCSVVSNSLRPHGLQHARLLCPPPVWTCLMELKLLKWLNFLHICSKPSDIFILFYFWHVGSSGPITSWEIWGNRGNSVRLYFSGLQNHYRWWLQPWN